MKKLFSSKYSDNTIAFALLLSRLALGGLMIPHGYKKLMNFAAKSSTFADPLHIGPTFSMALTIFAEFFLRSIYSCWADDAICHYSPDYCNGRSRVYRA